MRASLLLLVLAGGLPACQGDPEPETLAELGRPDLLGLEAPRLLRRMSLDLRGVLPTERELDRVEADPAALEDLRDAFLDDPRLEDRLVSLLAERWHTRVDVFDIEYYDYDLPAVEEFPFEQAVGEEPLRLMAHVAVQDLPWTDVVTADYTRANDVLASLWPLDYPEGAEGWQVARYTDGRPAVGVLATNGLWWRYNTDTSNMNRKRAAAISRLLLCVDFLARPVSFSAQTSDVGDIAQAVRTDPYCLACHSALDPIAASLFGFWWLSQYNVFEETVYHPEREPLGPETLGVETAWFGQPMDGLSELGVRVANDPRFTSCAAESTASMLWRRPTTGDDRGRLLELETAFVDQDLRMKALLREVTDTPEYRAGGVVEETEQAEAEVAARMLSPDLLGSTIEDLTGFRWHQDGFDQLGNDGIGYRVLAGGVDGANTYSPQADPGLTWALTTQRLAQAGADYAVQRELVLGGEPRRLFGSVSLDTRPDDAAFSAELGRLWWRLLGERPEDGDLEALTALWSTIEATEGPAAAWTTVVTVLFRDPLFLST